MTSSSRDNLLSSFANGTSSIYAALKYERWRNASSTKHQLRASREVVVKTKNKEQYRARLGQLQGTRGIQSGVQIMHTHDVARLIRSIVTHLSSSIKSKEAQHSRQGPHSLGATSHRHHKKRSQLFFIVEHCASIKPLSTLGYSPLLVLSSVSNPPCPLSKKASYLHTVKMDASPVHSLSLFCSPCPFPTPSILYPSFPLSLEFSFFNHLHRYLRHQTNVAHRLRCKEDEKNRRAWWWFTPCTDAHKQTRAYGRHTRKEVQ